MCWNCGTPISDPDPIGRSLRCSSCGKDLRCCKHCKFYLPTSRNDCKESGAEYQQDKERANFCDWFSLDPKFRISDTGQNGKSEDPKKSEARSAFDKLFS